METAVFTIYFSKGTRESLWALMDKLEQMADEYGAKDDKIRIDGVEKSVDSD